MSPRLRYFVFLFCELSIVYKHISTKGKIHIILIIESTWVLESQFIICEKNKTLVLFNEFIL